MKTVLMLPDLQEWPCNDSYALRLVEQGKAILAPTKEDAPKVEKAPENSKAKRH